MRRKSMFTRLMTVFLAAILVCSAILMIFSYFSTRTSMINTFTKGLKSEAYDLAYLASQVETARRIPVGSNSTVTKYIRKKAQSIYERYSAFCIVIDRTGSSRAYINENLLEDEDILSSFDPDELNSLRKRVLTGEEVIAHTSTSKGTMFTVAVPWMHDSKVNGAVIVQTSAQTIQASYTSLLIPLLCASVVAVLVAGISIYFFTRHVTHPLIKMDEAARKMSSGNFSMRVPVQGSSEICSLAESFNHMAGELGELETSRREFLANVSHELRSPITSIQGYMQSMLDGTIQQEDQPKYMETVLDETKRLSKLIGGLLNLSRMEREDMQLAYSDFDLNELIRRVLISKINQIEEKNLEIQVGFSEESCFVHADSEQIEQVLINLIDNAVKYTHEGGKIILNSEEKNQLISVTVADNGPQIPPEDAPHIFDRFYKVDKAHTVGKGTGLGLAICKSIMEKHGQTIRLLDVPVGVAFEFTLEKGKPTAALLHDYSGERKTELDP